MAASKAKPGIDIVFGMGGGKPADSGAHEEAEDALKSAAVDAGLSEDGIDNFMGALHNYIESCIKNPPAPDADNDEDEY